MELDNSGLFDSEEFVKTKNSKLKSIYNAIDNKEYNKEYNKKYNTIQSNKIISQQTVSIQKENTTSNDPQELITLINHFLKDNDTFSDITELSQMFNQKTDFNTHTNKIKKLTSDEYKLHIISKYPYIKFNAQQLSYLEQVRHTTQLPDDLLFFLPNKKYQNNPVTFTDDNYMSIINEWDDKAEYLEIQKCLNLVISQKEKTVSDFIVKYLILRIKEYNTNDNSLFYAIANYKNIPLSEEIFDKLLKKYDANEFVTIKSKPLDVLDLLSQTALVDRPHPDIVNKIIRQVNFNYIHQSPNSNGLSRLEKILSEATEKFPEITDETWQHIFSKTLIDRARDNSKNHFQTTALAVALAKKATLPNNIWSTLFLNTKNFIEYSLLNYIINYNSYNFSLDNTVFEKISKNINEKTFTEVFLNSYKLPPEKQAILLNNIKELPQFPIKIYTHCLEKALEKNSPITQPFILFILEQLQNQQNINFSLKKHPVLTAIENQLPEQTIFAIIDKLPQKIEKYNNVVIDYMNSPQYQSDDVFYKMLDKYDINEKDEQGNTTLARVFQKNIFIAPEQLTQLIKRTRANAFNQNKQTPLNIALLNNYCMTTQQWQILVNKTNTNIKPRTGMSCRKLLLESSSNIDDVSKKKINHYYFYKFIQLTKIFKKDNPSLIPEINKDNFFEQFPLKLSQTNNEYIPQIQNLFDTLKLLHKQNNLLVAQDKIKINNEYPTMIQSLFDKSLILQEENKNQFQQVIDLLYQDLKKIEQKYISIESKDLRAMKRYLEASK